MPSWTKEQEVAISKSGCNIIVSAGAGSGKTAVLTERVIRKLINGCDISNLLILTFTNAAAKEMKERIRAAIKKEGLKEQLEKIDSSFITTFDSFALSIVKKYHYLLNIDSNVAIADSLVLKFKKIEILDKIFDDLYEEGNIEFLNLISKFTTRDDSKIKNAILEIYDKVDLMYERDSYLENYMNYYYNDNYITEQIDRYIKNLRIKINKIKDELSILEMQVDGDYYYEFVSALNNLLNSTNYDEIKKNLEIKLPRLKKGMGDEVKETKEKISKTLDEIKKICIYEDYTEIKTGILETGEYVNILIKILKRLIQEFEQFKSENRLYDFLDIAKLSIKIVSEFESARSELKNSFSEIMVDEYQDTSDLQELFISKISNNNVYMVGDIKQSIYRFRNANPNLFKEKYVNYEQNIGGFKIDLVKNFRSRLEVLDNINYVFDYIMDLELGGADYKKSHRMVFGNTIYNELKENTQDYNFEIYNYDNKTEVYSNDEIEAFTTLKDIKDKVNSKYQVYDKNSNKLRDATYDDFVILIDKSTNFSLYKQIFENNGVSLTIIKDENISGSNDLLIIKNILILIKKMKEKHFDTEFWYSYLSIGRSYLFNLDDNYLYLKIKSGNIENDPIIELINELTTNIDIIPVNKLISSILSNFSFYEKLISVGNINESIIRLEYLEELSMNLSNLGYTYLDLIDYFNKMLEYNEKITYSRNLETKNSVKIMTIHKSKGLEYPICYYTGLTSKFNTMDIKKRFFYSNKFGIIVPFIRNGMKNTIYHMLYKEDFLREDISERIRLFYVALTRAREKMIIITSLSDNDNISDDLVSVDIRLKYNSLASILNSIRNNLTSYIKEIDLNSINLNKDYTMIKNYDINNLIDKTNDLIKVEELSIKNNYIENMHFSKNNLNLIDDATFNKMEFGTKLHECLEYIDFYNIDLNLIDSKYQDYINNLFNNDLFKNIKNSLNIYKEYEFIYYKDNNKLHGIIDLMIEYSDYIDIIDYKLKNLSDKEYIKQLNGYKEYISTITNKKINLYLYSIIDSRYITL
ncbi:MAG: UvrD-helicase domain-containing protein [Bacilli bacterium]|nr:UvrD-helicase domain-containing protein [Bacilli bacterium]